ncbi:carboxypeptidase-like regulatory domain-containing protein [Marivirga atlantica]|uniref:TonB-dependent receptor n=1 Tax=Marivirga atlantica TaxID=1548457 RepID=A0A937AEC7_9BACT|nr:carboxypeptidase-like regulatory domain-containing protein [Marivirga atlantica]MBL0764064.1 TonB-dependent receptor [Marivirga atlantica]
MKKLYFLFVFFLAAITSKAQTIYFEGKVVDSVSTPIEFANVIAQDTTTKAITGFAVTDTEGRFKLALKSNSVYLLKVSFVGYVTFEKEFNTQTEDFKNVIIELEVANDLLNEVQVVHEMPVTMSGDTLIYKSEAFTNGSERKLEDVLAKLPGMEVDENGEVKVQGKKVNKVLVDGKQFFDGDTKMATKNLPANAVDRVQVLKNYNEIGPMDGLGGEDNLALNIQLKEGKKNLLFGDVTLGAGPQSRYLGHANLFYYSPKTNVNLIADANNIGEQAFTMQDYFRFSGGLSSIAANAGTDMNISNEDLGFPMANRETAQDLSTKLTAANFNFNPNKKWYHSGFFIGSAAQNTFGSLSQRRYLREGAGSEELLATELTTQQRSGLLKYAATYTPKKETFLRYSLFGKLSSQNNLNNRLSIVSGAQNSIRQTQEQKPYSLEQQLEWYHTPSEKNVFSLESNYTYKRFDPSIELESDQPLFDSFLPITSTQEHRLKQSRNIESQQSTTAFNYYRILNKTNHVNLSSGYHLQRQNYSSSIEQVLDETTIMFDSSAFNNENQYNFLDMFAGLTYKTKMGPVIISPSMYLHSYQVKDKQQESLKKRNPSLLLPAVYAKWTIRSTQSLSFRYAMEAKFADVRQRALGITIADYNALWRGNRLLTNGLTHSYNLYYNYFDLFSGMNLFGNMSYQYKIKDFSNSTAFEAFNRLNGVFNSIEPNEHLNAMFRVDKRFNLFKIKAGAELIAFRNNNNINGVATNNRSVTQQYNAGINTTFFKKLDFELGYKQNINQYTSSAIKNSFITYNPYARLDCDFGKRIHFQTSYNFNAFENKETKSASEFSIWNAFIRYRKSSTPWEFKLAAYNLLNTQGVRRDSFNENLISSYEYYIQQRYFTFSIRYEI